MKGRRRVQCSFLLLEQIIQGKMVRDAISSASKDAEVVDVFRHNDDHAQSFSIILESDEWEPLKEGEFPPSLIIELQDVGTPL